jgi:multiple antibiotic resistance protein
MADISLVQVFMVLFIGMGPIKVLFVFISMTQSMNSDLRRKVAYRTVLVAGVVAFTLLILGAALQAILHFSIGSLAIIGGLILLSLALQLVLGGKQSSHKASEQSHPMSLAISPLAIPLTLNPVGVVFLVILSAEIQNFGEFIPIALMIVGIAVIDLALLMMSEHLAKHLTPAVIELIERVLGILLGALAIQLILAGLDDLGIISMKEHS